MREFFNRPILVHSGKNYLRYLTILLLTGIIILGLYSIQFVGYIMLIIILSALIGLISIRFPFLYLFKDQFLIEKRCILKKYSDQEIFKFEEIQEIEFKKGYTKWFLLILQTMLGKGASGGFSEPDQMRLKFKNGKKRIIYRFGKRKEFINIVYKIEKELTPST
jgi:hypothetical protein